MSKGKVQFMFFTQDSVMSKSIDEVDFSVRTYNALKRNDIHTIGDIVYMWDSLTQLRGLGDRSIMEVRARLFALNFNNIIDDEKKLRTFAESLGLAEAV